MCQHWPTPAIHFPDKHMLTLAHACSMFSHLVETYFQTSEEDAFCFALPCPQPMSQLGGWCTSGTDIKSCLHMVNFVEMLISCRSIRALWNDLQTEHLFVLILFFGIVTCLQQHNYNIVPKPTVCNFCHLSPNLCLRMWKITDSNHSEYESSMMTTDGQKMLCTLKTTCQTWCSLQWYSTPVTDHQFPYNAHVQDSCHKSLCFCHGDAFPTLLSELSDLQRDRYNRVEEIYVWAGICVGSTTSG
jgi:hypothetical protein